MRLIREQLNWGTKAELKTEVLRGIKEIGSVIYTMGLLDIVLVSPVRRIVRKLTSLNDIKSNKCFMLVHREK